MSTPPALSRQRKTLIAIAVTVGAVVGVSLLVRSSRQGGSIDTAGTGVETAPAESNSSTSAMTTAPTHDGAAIGGATTGATSPDGTPATGGATSGSHAANGTAAGGGVVGWVRGLFSGSGRDPGGAAGTNEATGAFAVLPDGAKLPDLGARLGSANASGEAAGGSAALAQLNADGSLGAGAGVAGAEGLAEAANPEAPKNCFTLQFRHKALASHGDDEACSQHRNVIKLRHADYHAASLCVRVNGTPVRHVVSGGKRDEIQIGSLAGPHAVITASYCVKPDATCRQECRVPKDDFLATLGAGEAAEADGGEEGARKTARWDASDDSDQHSGEVARIDAELRKELEEPGAAKLAGGAFRDWVGSESETAACGSPATVPAGARSGRRTASVAGGRN